MYLLYHCPFHNLHLSGTAQWSEKGESTALRHKLRGLDVQKVVPSFADEEHCSSDGMKDDLNFYCDSAFSCVP